MEFMKRALRDTLGRIEGKKAYQRLFERLYAVALKGMNYGRGDQLEWSGELDVIRHVWSSLEKLDDNIVLFDVGANVGKYSSALLNAFTMPNVTVHAFEPSGATFKQLKGRFGDDRRVKTHKIGFSDKPGLRRLYADQPLSGLASLYQRRLGHRDIRLGRSETVKLTTIDAFCRIHGIHQVHFLKLDVEGHELSALRGARRMIENGRISFIQWEFGGCNIDSRTFFQDFFYLLNDRYTLYRLVKDGRRPISRYQETLEIFTTANYLAELRV